MFVLISKEAMDELCHEKYEKNRTSHVTNKKAMNEFSKKSSFLQLISLFEVSEDVNQSNDRNEKVWNFVSSIANKIRSIDCVFNRGAGENLFQKDFHEKDKLKSLQANILSSLRNATSHNVSVIGTITSHV